MSVTTITGKNAFLASQKLNDIRSKFIEQNGTAGIIEIDGEEATIAQVIQHAMSQDLFASASLVILRDIASNSQLQDDLADKIEEIPDATEFVIYEPKLDKRKKFYKTVRHATNFVECVELDEREMVQWARDAMSGMGGELGFAEAQHLVQRVSADQWLLYNELQKLALVERKVSKDLIDEMVAENFNDSIFNLLDSAFSGQTDKALTSYRKMLENKIESFYVFSMIAWQLHILLVVAVAKGVSPEQIAKDNKLSPFVVKKAAGVLRKTSTQDLKRLVNRAVKVDIDSKTKASYNMDAAVDALIASMAT